MGQVVARAETAHCSTLQHHRSSTQETETDRCGLAGAVRSSSRYYVVVRSIGAVISLLGSGPTVERWRCDSPGCRRLSQAVVPGARLGGSGEKSLRSCDFVNDCSKRVRAG